jgi:hypothetical protein
MDLDLQLSAERQLEKLGVHIRTNVKVANMTRGTVELYDRRSPARGQHPLGRRARRRRAAHEKAGRRAGPGPGA